MNKKVIYSNGWIADGFQAILTTANNKDSCFCDCNLLMPLPLSIVITLSCFGAETQHMLVLKMLGPWLHSAPVTVIYCILGRASYIYLSLYNDMF